MTQYDPLYLLSTIEQVVNKRENKDESNMFKENFIKEMFKSVCDGPDMDLIWT